MAYKRKRKYTPRRRFVRRKSYKRKKYRFKKKKFSSSVKRVIRQTEPYKYKVFGPLRWLNDATTVSTAGAISSGWTVMANLGLIEYNSNSFPGDRFRSCSKIFAKFLQMRGKITIDGFKNSTEVDTPTISRIRFAMVTMRRPCQTKTLTAQTLLNNVTRWGDFTPSLGYSNYGLTPWNGSTSPVKFNGLTRPFNMPFNQKYVSVQWEQIYSLGQTGAMVPIPTNNTTPVGFSTGYRPQKFIDWKRKINRTWKYNTADLTDQNQTESVVPWNKNAAMYLIACSDGSGQDETTGVPGYGPSVVANSSNCPVMDFRASLSFKEMD